MRLQVIRSVAIRLDSEGCLGKRLVSKIAKRRKSKGKLETRYC